MLLSDFDFEIPEALIAYHPSEKRDNSRLLVVDRSSHTLSHKKFSDFPQLVTPQDLLVLNNTKVIPARLVGKLKESSIEVFLLKKLADNQWQCLVKPGKKVKSDTRVEFGEGVFGLLNREGDDFFCRFENVDSGNFYGWLERNGKIPLPVYIKREADAGDFSTYQTVFAKNLGSVAAPTAGLHFTRQILETIRNKGVATEEVTLHVGYGTFAPIKTENIADHRMHFEDYEVLPDLPQKLAQTKNNGGRVIAVGTTSLRTLESIPIHGLNGSTNLFIKPGYELRNVDALLTNFHTPKSSLFVLVCALVGTEWAKEIYRAAVAEKYRFYSYGDAMLIL